MKKPERKSGWFKHGISPDNMEGYNQACSEWEKYHESCKWFGAGAKLIVDNLPSEEKIIEIMEKFNHYYSDENHTKSIGGSDIPKIAEEIHKRLRGENQ